MPGTTTPYLGLYKPADGETGYGPLVGGNFDTLDALLGTAWINVTQPPYNAVGDGVTDDSVALQAAYDAAVALGACTLVYPPRNFRHETGLVLAPASGQIHINMLGLGGVGGDGVRLTYAGTGGVALTIQNNTRYTVDNLALVNAGSGTTEGLAVKSLTAGSNSGPAHWRNIRIAGFTRGAHFGDASDFAASEQLFSNFEVQSCTNEGIFLEDSTGAYNTTNFNFHGLYVTNCATGLRWTGPPGANGPLIHVGGGSFSQNGLDFDFETPAQVHLHDMHIDSGGSLIRVGPAVVTDGTGAEAHVLLENVQTSYAAATGGIVAKFHHAGKYTVRNCVWNNGGQIQLDGESGALGALIVENSTINHATPIAYTGNRTAWNIRLFNVGKDTANPSSKLADRSYTISSAGVETDLSPTSGSWTPAVGGTATYISQVGYWTKIGNVVTLTCNLEINVLGTGSVNTVSGLPFPIKAGSRMTGACYFGDLAVNIMHVGLWGLVGTTTFQVRAITAVGKDLLSSTSIFANSAEIAFSATYLTD